MRLSESPRIRCHEDDDGEVLVTIAVAAVVVAVTVGKTEKHV